MFPFETLKMQAFQLCNLHWIKTNKNHEVYASHSYRIHVNALVRLRIGHLHVNYNNLRLRENNYEYCLKNVWLVRKLIKKSSYFCLT